MPFPLLALGASFLASYIPTIIDYIAGSDDAAEARQKLAPRVNDMVAQMVGRGMRRDEALAAAEEAIQAAVKEGTGKGVMPAWTHDAFSVAGMLGGGAALGGGKLLSAGAKMLSAKASGAAAKAGQMATNMDRSAAAQMRKLDPKRADALAKGPAKMDAPDAPAATPPAGATRIKKADDTNDVGLDDSFAATQPLRNPFKPALLPAPKGPRARQPSSARNDDPIEMGGEGPALLPAPRGRHRTRDAEFEVVRDPINAMPTTGLRSPFAAGGDLHKVMLRTGEMPSREQWTRELMQQNRRSPNGRRTVRPDRQLLEHDADAYLEDIMRNNPE
jgi:hypothetical protein